jgi:hypothetical protein
MRESPEFVAPEARQPGETAKQFAKFCFYRDMTPATRSLNGAYRAARAATRPDRPQTGREVAPGTWKRLSQQHDWIGRVRAYEARLDAERRREQEEAIRQMHQRHIQAAQAAQFVCVLPLRILVDHLQRDPEAAKRELGAAKFSRMLKLIAPLLRHLPTAQHAERLARGLETERIRFETLDAEQRESLADLVEADANVADAVAEFMERLTMGRPALPPNDSPALPSLPALADDGEPL